MNIPKLHCITYDQAPYTHFEQVEFVIKSGLKWVQVRIKNRSESTSNEILEITKLCKEHQVTCIINDYYEFVIPSKASGYFQGLTTATKSLLANCSADFSNHRALSGGVKLFLPSSTRK